MNICVFCSSCDRIAPVYIQTAFRLGEFIAENAHTLVYGGAKGGLMTAVAEGAKSKMGEIVGVIADPIVRMNRQSDLPSKQIRLRTLLERKEKMKELADIFLVLPGSYGTLDEMFDVMASGVVGEHSKKMLLFNMNGFFDLFLLQIEKMKVEKCIPKKETYNFDLVSTLDECQKKIITLSENLNLRI